MAKLKLEARTISLRARDRRSDVFDVLLPGFGIRVSPNGRKTWFVFTRRNKRQSCVTPGLFPNMSLAEAREAARSALISTSVDEEPAPIAVLSLRDAIPEFVEKHARAKNRSWRDTQRDLKKFEVIACMPLDAIRRPDVVRVLDGIIAAGAATRANRALAAIKKLFAWYLDRGEIETNPIAGLRPPSKEISRDRVLSVNELRRCWEAANREEWPFGQFLKVLMLTAQRRGEVAEMKWSEIDFDAATWTILATRAKNGTTHLVPLSPVVLQVLATVPRLESCDLVFTTTGRSPISGFGRLKERIDIIVSGEEWRLHDAQQPGQSGQGQGSQRPRDRFWVANVARAGQHHDMQSVSGPQLANHSRAE
jgi:integrase